MRLLPDYWLKLRSPSGLFVDTNVLETQGLNSSVERIKLSPDIFETADTEFFSHNIKFSSALLGELGIENTFDGNFNIIRRLSIKADLNNREILATINSIDIRGALGSI